jgi:predicted nuclease of restriction endonuclease-like (RecB) superfamily
MYIPDLYKHIPYENYVELLKTLGGLARRDRTTVSDLTNAYNLEFLSLGGDHAEPDLHAALRRNLGRFITELGRDLRFVSSDYGQLGFELHAA